MKRQCKSPLERRYRNAHPLRTFVALFEGHYRVLLLGMFFGVVKHTPLMVMPIVIGNVVTIVTSPQNHSLREIWLNAAFIAILLVQNIPMHTLFTRYISIAIRNVESELRSALVRRLQELSIAFHDNFESGRLHSKILRDVEAVEMLARNAVNTIFFAALTTIFSFVVTVSKDLLVALFFFVSVPVAVVLIRFFRDKVSLRNRELRWEIESMSARVSEMVAMLPITRAHALEHKEIQSIDSKLEQVRHKGIAVDVVNALFQSSTWVSFETFQFVCLLFTGYLAYKGRIKVGDVVMYQGFFGAIVGSISQVVGVYPMLSKGFESIRSMGEVLECPDLEFNKGKRCVDSVDGGIEFCDVSFQYDGASRPAVHDFSCRIDPGQCVAFVGESGSGKSTLMNLVIGFRRPTSGKILLDGTDMEELDLRSYRRSLAVVSQNTVLFSGTVRENITYGLENVPDSRLKEIVAAANLTDVLDALPQGIETMIGEHGAKLSGGQRQRVAIARALIRDPRIIILDEATSALDVVSERLVQEAIERLIAGRTTLIVAHRLSTIRQSDKINVMRQGKVVEQGTHTELVDRRGEFHRFLTLQT